MWSRSGADAAPGTQQPAGPDASERQAGPWVPGFRGPCSVSHRYARSPANGWQLMNDKLARRDAAGAADGGGSSDVTVTVLWDRHSGSSARQAGPRAPPRGRVWEPEGGRASGRGGRGRTGPSETHSPRSYADSVSPEAKAGGQREPGRKG